MSTLEIFVWDHHLGSLAAMTGTNLYEAALKTQKTACLKTLHQCSLQDMLTPSQADWLISVGKTPTEFLYIQTKPHLYWDLGLEPCHFPWDAAAWLGAPYELPHPRSLFLPHAISPHLLPALAPRFPVVMFSSIQDAYPFVESIGDIPVHLFGQHAGAHWFSRLSYPTSRYLHPLLPYLEHHRVLQQSKILLILQPQEGNFSHPWILPALVAGCLVLMTPNPYAQQLFAKDDDLWLDPQKPERVHSTIQTFLQDNAYRKRRVKELQAKILPQVNWSNRLQSVQNQLLE